MTFQVIAARCSGPSDVIPEPSEEAAYQRFLEQVEVAMRMWKDPDIENHITSVTWFEASEYQAMIFTCRCRHQIEARARRA